MFINVLEPDTINDPVIIVLPFTFKNGVIVTPELVGYSTGRAYRSYWAYWTGRSGSSYYYYIIISTCCYCINHLVTSLDSLTGPCNILVTTGQSEFIGANISKSYTASPKFNIEEVHDAI
jgi:hypothetical protein